MKTLVLASAIASALMLSGCNPKTDTSTAANPPPNAADTPAATEQTPTPASTPAAAEDENTGDGLALGLLAAVNENEISAAKQAQEKGVKGAVLEYAKMMDKEHSENLEKTKSLGTLADNDDVKAVKSKGSEEASMLGQKSGKDYEKAYIDAMVAGHKDALAMIDSKMMAAATSEPVKQHLSDTRKHVEMHLTKAEQIQKSM